MTDKQHPALFDWATELLDAEGHVTLSAKEAHEIGARLRSMGAKLKTYEDLGDAGSDVLLLRMGYAAARLEIESLKSQLHAAKQINAAQFGLLAASIPGNALRASHGQAPAAVAGCTRSHPHENMDSSCRAKTAIAEMRSKAVRGAEATAQDLERFVRMLAAAPSPTAQADSVQEDAARLDFLIKQRAYVVSDPDACPGYWLHFIHKETGKCWAQGDEHLLWCPERPRDAIQEGKSHG